MPLSKIRICLVLCLLGFIQSLPSLAESFSSPYFSPGTEAWLKRSQRSITLNSRTNLNQASMEELMSLPNMNRDVALRLTGIRPLRNLNDLNRIDLPEETRERLKQGWNHRVTF
jgi:hypothetical protein